MLQSSGKANGAKRVNVRSPEVMERVQKEVETHYRSELVELIRKKGGVITLGQTTFRLAKEFGFCYGVERAIDLAYASRRVFPNQKIYLLGEIIHNPEVNRQLKEMGIMSIPIAEYETTIAQMTEEDVVIVPAFGAETTIMKLIRERGCQVVDTTCGDVMSVWKRVRHYAKDAFTSIIHGKSSHEETKATASRALGDAEVGHFLIVLTLADVEYVTDYIINGGDRKVFFERFQPGVHTSFGFDPDMHLVRIGVANQTTMLKSETEEVQKRFEQAMVTRYGQGHVQEHFRVADTICGATQERQDSLFDLLKKPLDMLFVVGGYNSSNTTHLVEIGQEVLPTFFIRSAECLVAVDQVIHYDLHDKAEKKSYIEKIQLNVPLTIGITAGASCPNNLIEDTIRKILEFRQEDKNALSLLFDELKNQQG
jgi:4-hydroxy-3-methylbut-2-enyl diphosphate reductase